MYVVKEQERRVRCCLFFPFLRVLWPLCIGIPLSIIEAWCMGTWLQVTEDQDPRRWDKSHGWLKRARSTKEEETIFHWCMWKTRQISRFVCYDWAVFLPIDFPLILDRYWIWQFLPFGCWIFLIFINYSWHCLQTLLISWEQLYFLKACCSGLLTDIIPAFRPCLVFPTSKAILSSGLYWCHGNYE